VEMAVAVIVGFRNGKISHEHIYWDQASVLVQIGLLNPTGLPVGGAEIARKIVNPKLPSRRF
jgi:carboxymethylenebutenolidase